MPKFEVIVSYKLTTAIEIEADCEEYARLDVIAKFNGQAIEFNDDGMGDFAIEDVFEEVICKCAHCGRELPQAAWIGMDQLLYCSEEHELAEYKIAGDDEDEEVRARCWAIEIEEGWDVAND